MCFFFSSSCLTFHLVTSWSYAWFSGRNLWISTRNIFCSLTFLSLYTLIYMASNPRPSLSIFITVVSYVFLLIVYLSLRETVQFINGSVTFRSFFLFFWWFFTSEINVRYIVNQGDAKYLLHLGNLHFLRSSYDLKVLMIWMKPNEKNKFVLIIYVKEKTLKHFQCDQLCMVLKVIPNKKILRLNVKSRVCQIVNRSLCEC